MTHGCASDIKDDDTVMESPEATLSIDLSQLPPERALAIAREAGLEQQDRRTLGCWVRGEEADGSEIYDAEFHIPIEAALTALDELNVIDLQPPQTDE